MSGYIGTQPVPQATQTRDSFTATSGQTSFATGGYTPNFLDVYLNGVKLASADYTASNGSDVVLASGAATGDILEVVAFTTFSSDDRTLNNAGTVLTTNRTGSDGTIVDLQKDGSTVGSIGSAYRAASGDSLYFVAGDTGIIASPSEDSIVPVTTNGAGRDAAINLGISSTRFKDLYLSGGVYLGGTGSANKLSSYEHGTWTPSFEGDTTAGSYTYVEQQGHYVRVGNQVTAWVNLTNITTGSAGSGRIAITGLPYSANWMSGFNGESVGVIGLHGFAGINGTFIMPIVQDGLNKIFVYNFEGSSNTSSVINVTDKIDNGSDIRGFVTYYIGG